MIKQEVYTYIRTYIAIIMATDDPYILINDGSHILKVRELNIILLPAAILFCKLISNLKTPNI